MRVRLHLRLCIYLSVYLRMGQRKVREEGKQRINKRRSKKKKQKGSAYFSIGKEEEEKRENRVVFVAFYRIRSLFTVPRKREADRLGLECMSRPMSREKDRKIPPREIWIG